MRDLPISSADVALKMINIVLIFQSVTNGCINKVGIFTIAGISIFNPRDILASGPWRADAGDITGVTRISQTELNRRWSWRWKTQSRYATNLFNEIVSRISKKLRPHCQICILKKRVYLQHHHDWNDILSSRLLPVVVCNYLGVRLRGCQDSSSVQ